MSHENVAHFWLTASEKYVVFITSGYSGLSALLQGSVYTGPQIVYYLSWIPGEIHLKALQICQI